MAITVMDTAQNKQLAAIGFCCLFIAPISAGEFRFTPTATFKQTYSDNAELTSDEKTSTSVSEFVVALNNQYMAKHLEFNLNSASTYAMYSHDSEQNSDYHDLNADLRYKFWPNGIDFVAKASITNSGINNGSNAIADIISADIVQVENYVSGLAYNINNSQFLINSSVNYVISKSDDNIGEQEGYNASFSSANGTSSRTLFWNINGSYQNLENNNFDSEAYSFEAKLGLLTDFKLTPFLRYYKEDNKGSVSSGRPLTMNSAGLGFKWLIIPSLTAEISYNKSDDSAKNSDNGNKEHYFDAEISWSPSRRTNLIAGMSERFYGNSYNLNLKHSNKRFSNTITYNESIEAFNRDRIQTIVLGNYWCPNNESIEINSCYINNDQLITPEGYSLITLRDFEVIEGESYNLRKLWNSSSTVKLNRTSFNLTLNYLDSLELDTDINNIGKSASFTVNRKVSGNSSLSLSYSFKEDAFGTQGNAPSISRYRIYDITYDKKLNSRFNISFGSQYLNRNTTNYVQLNYKELRVYFNINKSF